MSTPKVIVTFNPGYREIFNDKDNLSPYLGIQFILEKKIMFQSASFLRKPFFENDILLLKENDINRLNKFYSIYDISKEDQIEKIFEFFKLEKENNYFLVNAFHFPFITIHPIDTEDNNHVEINKSDSSWKINKKWIKLGCTNKISGDKTGMFNFNNPKHIKKVFNVLTWYKNRVDG